MHIVSALLFGAGLILACGVMHSCLASKGARIMLALQGAPQRPARHVRVQIVKGPRFATAALCASEFQSQPATRTPRSNPHARQAQWPYAAGLALAA